MFLPILDSVEDQHSELDFNYSELAKAFFLEFEDSEELLPR